MHKPAPPTASRLQPLALLLALSLAGCAELPSLAAFGTPKPAGDYTTTQAFAAPAASWPDAKWWTAYGDPQLDALIDEALRDSPDMAAAAARVSRAEAYGQATGAALLPQAGASASLTQEKQSYNYLFPKAYIPQDWNDYGRVGLDLRWELDFWGKNRAALAAATSETEAARAGQALARLNLAAAVAGQYADLAQLFAVRDTLERSVEVRRRTAQLFQERYDHGLETQGTVHEAKARLATAEGELLQAEEQIGLQRQRLAALLGAGPDRGLAIRRPAVNLAADFGLPAQLAADLLGRRPDVVAARLVAEAQARRIDQKKAEFYPNVNLVAFLGVQAIGLDMLSKAGSETGSFGPAISLPIFTAGRLRGELRGTAAAYGEAVASYNRTVTQALQEVAGAALSRQALGGQLAKGEAAVAAAGEAHRVASNRYAGGLANFIEVLYAEDNLLQNRRHLAVLQSRAFALDVALQRALGGGYQANPS